MLPLERERAIRDHNYKGCSMFDRARVRSNTQHFFKTVTLMVTKPILLVLPALGPIFIHVLYLKPLTLKHLQVFLISL
jgi:hypothetical protein